MINYKLKEYVEKGLQYRTLSLVKGVPEYNGKKMEVEELTYQQVKFVMNDLAEVKSYGTLKKIFETCFNVSKEDDSDWFWNGKVKEFFQARNYIIQEFKRLLELERKLLSSVKSVDSELWRMAGGEKLNRFGGALALNQLGKLYNQYPFDLKDKNYMEILLLLTMDKETREVEAKYDKLKKQT